MRNSLKQMMRTPVRTVFFLGLMVFAALLMTLGASIWMKGTQTMAQYEDRFMTIGTVRQIPDSFEQQMIWNRRRRIMMCGNVDSTAITMRRKICFFPERNILPSRSSGRFISLTSRII